MLFWIEENLYWASTIVLALLCLAILFFTLQATYFAYKMIFRREEEEYKPRFYKGAFMAFVVFGLFLFVDNLLK